MWNGFQCKTPCGPRTTLMHYRLLSPRQAAPLHRILIWSHALYDCCLKIFLRNLQCSLLVPRCLWNKPCSASFSVEQYYLILKLRSCTCITCGIHVGPLPWWLEVATHPVHLTHHRTYDTTFLMVILWLNQYQACPSGCHMMTYILTFNILFM